MKTELALALEGDHAVNVCHGDGALLLRYVYRPDTPLDEAPRPYAHPVCTPAGAVLTNFRPNDHRWHHGLSFTITCLGAHNFWGGPSYRRGEGYQWRRDQGSQHHVAWQELGADRLVHTLEWRGGFGGPVLLREQRALSFVLQPPHAWSLRWTATLENVSGQQLSLGQYRSREGLAGSHYTGLQFRGARDLLDDHGDAAVGIWNDAGVSGETAVHGAAGDWMEWRGQKDGSQQRVVLRFANNAGPLHWFVRGAQPLAALPFHYDGDHLLAPGAHLTIDHTLTFADA